jgi:hypothetical protein
MIKASIKHVVTLSDIGMVYTLCRLLENLLIPENVPTNVEAFIYEIFSVFTSL